MFLLYFLLFSNKDNCKFQVNDILSFQNYEFDTEAGDNICINITINPHYLVFQQFEDDTLYIQYTSNNNNLFKLDFVTLLRFLPIYQAYQDPFSSVTITTPSPTHIAFTSASIPGMCKDGIYFSTLAHDSITLKPDALNFFSLNPYDDKCILFADLADDIIVTTIESDDNEDQLFVYTNFTDYYSFNGNSTFSITSASDSPLLMRIVADDSSPPTLIRIIKNSTNPKNVRNPGMDWFVNKKEPQECNNIKTWYSEGLVIFIIVCTLFFGVVSVSWISVLFICNKYTNRVVYKEATDSSADHSSFLPDFEMFSIRDSSMENSTF